MSALTNGLKVETRKTTRVVFANNYVFFINIWTVIQIKSIYVKKDSCENVLLELFMKMFRLFLKILNHINNRNPNKDSIYKYKGLF